MDFRCANTDSSRLEENTERVPEFRLEREEFPLLNAPSTQTELDEGATSPQEMSSSPSLSESSCSDSPNDSGDSFGENFDLKSLLQNLQKSSFANFEMSNRLVWDEFKLSCRQHNCQLETICKSVVEPETSRCFEIGLFTSNACKHALRWDYGTALWPDLPNHLRIKECRFFKEDRQWNRFSNSGFAVTDPNEAFFENTDDCYRLNCQVHSKLVDPMTKLDNEDLLFFLFYTNPHDIKQLIVSDILFKRRWRWSKKHNLWFYFKEDTNIQPRTGRFDLFCPITWNKFTVEMEYSVKDFVVSPISLPFPVDVEHFFKNRKKPEIHESLLRTDNLS